MASVTLFAAIVGAVWLALLPGSAVAFAVYWILLHVSIPIGGESARVPDGMRALLSIGGFLVGLQAWKSLSESTKDKMGAAIAIMAALLGIVAAVAWDSSEFPILWRYVIRGIGWIVITLLAISIYFWVTRKPNRSNSKSASA